MADSSSLPHLRACEQETIEVALRVLETMKLEQKLAVVAFQDAGGAGEALCEQGADGTWSASVFSDPDDAWTGLWAHRSPNYRTSTTKQAVERLTNNAVGLRLRFYPDGIPEHERTIGLGGMDGLEPAFLSLLPLLRDEDQDCDERALYNLFTDLALKSGYKATKLFLETVRPLLAAAVGTPVDIDDEIDTQGLYKDKLKVSNRALVLFDLAANTAAQAVRYVELSDAHNEDDFVPYILESAAVSYKMMIEARERGEAKRGATDDAEGQSDTKKART
jgi:hypothetical protein